MAKARFLVSEDGRTICDECFIIDALIRIDGDFGDDDERQRYAKWLADALNAADKPDGLEPRKTNMSNPHTTDQDKFGPLGPSIKPDPATAEDPVWTDLILEPGYQIRVMPDGKMQVRQKDTP